MTATNKPNARGAGRPAKKLSRELLEPVLKSLEAGPRSVRDIPVDDISSYLMERIVRTGLVTKSIAKIHNGPGRPSKNFDLTKAGREFLTKGSEDEQG